jgi:hypothetical protein
MLAEEQSSQSGGHGSDKLTEYTPASLTRKPHEIPCLSGDAVGSTLARAFGMKLPGASPDLRCDTPASDA